MIQELLVLGPLILILGVTVDARTRVDEYDPIAYGPILHKRILAYAEPVSEVRKMLFLDPGNVRDARARTVAGNWIRLANEKTLGPLPAAFDRDSMHEGTKGEILLAAEMLCGSLIDAGNSEADCDQYDQAAKDFVLALRVAQILKFSDLYSVGVLSARQRHALRSIEKVIPMLSRRMRTNAAQNLKDLANQQQGLDSIARHAKRLYAREFEPQSTPTIDSDDDVESVRWIHDQPTDDEYSMPDRVVLSSRQVRNPQVQQVNMHFAEQAKKMQDAQLMRIVKRLESGSKSRTGR
jgi:hypothetical protein